MLSKTIYSLIASCTVIFGSFAQEPLKLWYPKPAENWNEALPIGNGRLAAMIFGQPSREVLQLNEETVWAGEPGNNIIEGTYDSIQKMRKLIFESKFKEAQDLSNKTPVLPLFSFQTSFA